MAEHKSVSGAFPTLADSQICLDEEHHVDERKDDEMRFDSQVWDISATLNDVSSLAKYHTNSEDSSSSEAHLQETMSEDEDIVEYEETGSDGEDSLGIHGVESYEDFNDDEHTSGIFTEDGSNGEGPLLWRLNPKNSWSDWKIIVTEQGDHYDPNGTHSTTYHVHKALLASGPRRSRYFRRMFRTKQVAADTESENNSCELHLPYLSARAFPLFLDLIYDQSIRVDHKDAHISQHAVAILHLAEAYQVTDLVKEIKAHFIPQIDLEQACPYYRDAVAYEPPIHPFLNHILRVCTADVRCLGPTSALLRAMEPEFLLSIFETERRRWQQGVITGTKALHISRHLSTLIVGYVAFCEVEELSLPDRMLEMLTRSEYIPSIDFEVVLEWSRMVVPRIKRLIGSGEEAPVEGDPALNIQLRCLASIKENVDKVNLLDSSGSEYRAFLKSLPPDFAVDASLELTRLRQKGQVESVQTKYQALSECHAALEERAKHGDLERLTLRAERDELAHTLNRFELVVPTGGGGRKPASSLLKKMAVISNVPVDVPPGVNLPLTAEAGGTYHWRINDRPLFLMTLSAPMNSLKSSTQTISLRKNMSTNSSTLSSGGSDRSAATVKTSLNCLCSGPDPDMLPS